MPQSVSYLWQRTLRQSVSAEEPPFVRIDPTPRLREHTDLLRRTLRFAASMLAKTPRLPARIFRFRSLSRRSLPGTIRRKSRMTCTSSKQACGNKATNCSFGRFKTGSNIPVPLFIPPIIAGHNTTQITDDMYLIKTGMRKQGDKLQFWTLLNHSYTPDS